MSPIKSMVFKVVHEGATIPGKDIAVESSDFDFDQKLDQGSIVVHVLYASFDPFMRGRMRAKTVFPQYKLDQPIPALCVGQVSQSANSEYPIGSLVRGTLAISQYVRLKSVEISAAQFDMLRNPYNMEPSIFLGALGMPGLAAYASLYEIGKPKAGETLFVTAAAGAVGHIVGQLAKLEGVRVVGSAGSDEKVRWLKEKLGFDDAFNYKTEKATEALTRIAPEGIDIYFDNTGGEQLDAALFKMKPFGRIIGCGMMSLYNRDQNNPNSGIHGLFNLIVKRLTIRGFIVSDAAFGPAYAASFEEHVPRLISEGKVKEETTISDGIEAGPEGFVGMLTGKSFGKAVLRL